MPEEQVKLNGARSLETYPTGVTGDDRPVGLALVGAVAVWLTVSQWAIYPFTIVGQNNALRACGFAIVLGLAALLGWHASRRVIPGLVCAAAGVLLLIVAGLMPHVADRSVISEVVSGVVTLLAAALVLRDP
ncbi:hypothetical protein [Nocardioides bigeumensis]|uniref:SPW repeat-containing protein n=1 Tax=Nocardioides bigeumensis TaxID=433657 RepID=A0ABN2XMI1_9ACTN